MNSIPYPLARYGLEGVFGSVLGNKLRPNWGECELGAAQLGRRRITERWR